LTRVRSENLRETAELLDDFCGVRPARGFLHHRDRDGYDDAERKNTNRHAEHRGTAFPGDPQRGSGDTDGASVTIVSSESSHAGKQAARAGAFKPCFACAQFD
jgi:hypothetical protein